MPAEVGSIRREYVEAHIEHLLAHWRPATAAVRYRSLQQFFSLAGRRGRDHRQPDGEDAPPQDPRQPVAVLSMDEQRRLLESCKGREFANRRDAAISRVFIDTGARLAEVAGLLVTSLELDEGLLTVTGKGRRDRFLPIGPRTVKALDRYLRERARHHAAAEPSLWLGRKGPMTVSGISQMMDRRALQSGVTDLHAHRLRHTFAHQWLAAGGSEGGLMQVAGWRSREMLGR